MAYETEDEVSSTKAERFGKFEKPEDYLKSFSKFVKDNADKITALEVLLKRPANWQTAVLLELCQKLRENDYTERQLQKAHARIYQKELADIISMVKHAAKEDEPLLTAVERVQRAIKTVTQGKTFSPEQQNWLDLIQEHLTQNLTIDEDDLESMPIFEQKGGIGKARKVFGNQLPILIQEFNAAIAA